MNSKNLKLLISMTIILGVLTLSGYMFLGKKTMNIPSEINLKEIKLSDKATFSFDIKNKGISTVEVARIYTSCGCTTVISPTNKFEVKPGFTEKVTIQFDPSSMHKMGDDVYHEIYILTTKPSEKEFMVKMKGKIS
jgi:hypothetical protein